MKYTTRLRLRAIKHGIILLGSGLTGNIQTISGYITVHGNPNDFHVEHFGRDYYGSIIYEIKEAGSGYGFFAEFRTMVENLIFADKYGFIPTVRYGSEYLYYDRNYSISCDIDANNPFEYYFNPIGREIDVNRCANVIRSKADYAHSVELDYGSDGSHFTKEHINSIIGAIKKYVSLKPDILENILSDICSVVQEDTEQLNNTIGVHYRGTDYKLGFDGHPTAVSLDQIIEHIDIRLESGYDRIFIATDDILALKKLKKLYKERLVYYDDVFRGYGTKSVAFSDNNRANHKFRLGYEVLRDAYTLSMCGGFIGSLSQVSTFSRVLKKARDEAYRTADILDNGINNNLRFFNHGKYE